MKKRRLGEWAFTLCLLGFALFLLVERMQPSNTRLLAIFIGLVLLVIWFHKLTSTK